MPERSSRSGGRELLSVLRLFCCVAAHRLSCVATTIYRPLFGQGAVTLRAAFPAATLYADAAQRWQQFGNVPERAYALLGQGRCLRALGDPAAEQPLTEARTLFASMGYPPALAETDALLHQAEASATS